MDTANHIQTERMPGTPSPAMSFTAAQQDAIDTRGCTLLVAAGAGSGKTRVLTERIVRMITSEKEPADLSKLLVVTFTKAAAGEMLMRIRSALAAKLAAGPTGPEAKALLNAMALLPTASVCTIDSFCLDVVKSSFEKLGISPKVRLGMKNETEVLLRGVIDDLIEEKMSETRESPYFLTVYELLSGRKGDARFADTLRSFYTVTAGYPSQKAYFDRVDGYYAEILTDNGYDGHYGTLLKAVWQKELSKAEACIRRAAEMCRGYDILEQKYLPALQNDLEGLERLLSSPHTSYSSDASLLSAMQPGTARLGAARGFEDAEYLGILKKLRSDAKKYASALYDRYYACDAETLRLCASDMRNILSELRDLTLKIDERFSKVKRRAGMMEFSDLSRYVYSLVCTPGGEPTETAEALSKRYSHIFIDEYQDVNPIQDGLLRAIARRDEKTGAECNRFLVGDVKQSIYRFRGARPDIFESCRRAFADITQTDAPCRKVFMQHNFRCAEPVIDFTNALFGRLMPQSYSDEDALIFAKKEQCPVKDPVRLLIAGIPESAVAAERMLAEMQVIAQRIRTLVGNPQITGEAGQMYTFGDVAILTSKWKQAIALEQYLCDAGIPAYCERGELLFERAEVRLTVNILRAVDNPERDIPLAAFLRCSAGGFDDEALAGIRARHPDGSFHAALRRYAADGDDVSLRTRCAVFLEGLNELRRLSRRESASEFVRGLYERCQLESVVASPCYSNGPNDSASIRRANLQRFSEIAREYDKSVFRGLSDFLDYIEGMFDDDTVKSAGLQTQDCVRVMTVHQSKGLEFPVCILFGLDTDFRDDTDNLRFGEQHGLALNLRNLPQICSMPGESGYVRTVNMPFRDLLGSVESEEQLTEAIRVLYVGVTRARDRLILSCCVSDVGKRLMSALQFPAGCLLDPRSRLDLLLGAFADVPTVRGAAAHFGVPNVDRETESDLPCFVAEPILLTKEEIAAPQAVRPTVKTGSAPRDTDAWLAGIARSLEARREAAVTPTALPPKLTVSQLKHGLLEYEDMAGMTAAARQLQTMPSFIAEEQTLGAERGTAMHQFLQFADFRKCEKEGAAAAADELTEKAFITPRERELLDIPQLDAFFTTPLYARIKVSRDVRRELRFNLKESPANLLRDAPPTDDFILVQGVIDCFFENADGSYTVLDFKTDRIHGEAGERMLVERYANQLRYYARAVREITGKEVSDAILFSFALMKEIRVDVND